MLSADLDQAVAHYREAERLDPGDHRIVFKMAMALKKGERWADELIAIRRATSLAPTFANYQYELGFTLEAMAKRKLAPFAQAKTAYLRCIEIDPWLADCHERLGNVLLWTDDEQGALERYAEAARRDPDTLRHYLPLADLYLRLGHRAEAEIVLREAAKRGKPRDKALLAVYSLLAQASQERGALNEMVIALESAKEVAPEGSPEAVLILFSLGTTYARLTPPKAAESTQNLRAFSARACKGAKVSLYKSECAIAQALMTKLGDAGDPDPAVTDAPSESQSSVSSAQVAREAATADKSELDCGEPPGPYQARSAYSGPDPSLPPVPTISTGPTRVGDAYTVAGLIHHLRSRVHSDEVNGKRVSVVGYIVKTNYHDAPPCAVHRTGNADGPNCTSPVPSFTIADEKSGSRQTIQVMGWASNFSQIFTMIEEIDKAPKGRSTDVRLTDEHWGGELPNPLPSVGAKVKVIGTYGVTFTKGNGAAADPMSGIMTADGIQTLEAAPQKAYLPGMKRR